MIFFASFVSLRLRATKSTQTVLFHPSLRGKLFSIQLELWMEKKKKSWKHLFLCHFLYFKHLEIMS